MQAPVAVDPALGAHVQVGPVRMRVLTFAAVLQHGTLELQPGFVTEGEPSREKGELTVDALGRGRRPLATTMLPLQRRADIRAARLPCP